MSGLSIDAAILIAALTGNIIYGMFTVLYGTTVYVLVFKRKTPKPNYVLLAVATAMWIISTMIMGLSWSRIMDAFIVYRDTLGPVGYFAQVSNWKEVTRTALICIYLLCADGALVYRCWIVWGRQWQVVIVPFILFMGDIGAVTALIVTMATTKSNTVFISKLLTWVTAVVSFTLGQNIIVTSLIIWKIVKVNRAANAYNPTGSLTPLIALLVESGLLYLTTLFIFLMTYVAENNAQWIMLDILNGMIGVAFSMLIIRVGFGLTGSQSSRDAPTYYPSHGAGSHPLQPISISVNRRVDLENDIDGSSDYVSHMKEGDSKDRVSV